MKFNKLFALTLIAALAIIVPASAQSGQITVNVGRGQSLRAVCDVPFKPISIDGIVIDAICPALVLTASPVPSATHAPQKTATPTPSQIVITPSKTATSATPVDTPVGGVAPFKAALLCRNSDGDEHSDVTDSPSYSLFADNELWHDLWNEVSGCHYDHTHNDDPALADSVFGPAGAAWGQSISYPFMTPNENNMMGHSGYKYFVNLSPSPVCAEETFEYLNPDPNCVTAFRIQYHDVGGNPHGMKRFHSYYMEAQITPRNGGAPGTIQTGGWLDGGCIHVPYKEAFVLDNAQNPLNSDGSNRCGVQQSLLVPPYRAFVPFSEALSRAAQNRQIVSIWAPDSTYGYNKFGSFVWRVFDNASGMDTSDPYGERFVCPNFTCRYNNSEHGIVDIYFTIPALLDTDGDGRVTFEGFTDVRGNIVQSCTTPSANCVPLRIVNAPVGIALWSIGSTPPSPITPKLNVHDSDVYFNGLTSGWIIPR